MQLFSARCEHSFLLQNKSLTNCDPAKFLQQDKHFFQQASRISVCRNSIMDCFDQFDDQRYRNDDLCIFYKDDIYKLIWI